MRVTPTLFSLARAVSRRASLGAAGEAFVAQWFERAGYEVLARNWSCRVGELDLVVRSKSVLVFVEVRTVSTQWLASPTVSIRPAKQARVARAADAWIRSTGATPGLIRFDVAGVLARRGELTLEHIQDAFVPPWAY